MGWVLKVSEAASLHRRKWKIGGMACPAQLSDTPSEGVRKPGSQPSWAKLYRSASNLNEQACKLLHHLHSATRSACTYVLYTCMQRQCADVGNCLGAKFSKLSGRLLLFQSKVKRQLNGLQCDGDSEKVLGSQQPVGAKDQYHSCCLTADFQGPVDEIRSACRSQFDEKTNTAIDSSWLYD